jgi:hypothetical protein
VRLWVAPELSDPVGSLEVGEREDVEELGAGSRAEGVEAGSESALGLIGTHQVSNPAGGSTQSKRRHPVR